MLDPTAASVISRPMAGLYYPADVAQLRAWFASDDECLDYLYWLRWPDGFKCPPCASEATSRDTMSRYRCGVCRRSVSVTAGTIFEKTRVPMAVWFETMWLASVSKSGVSAAHLHRVLPISSIRRHGPCWLNFDKSCLQRTENRSKAQWKLMRRSWVVHALGKLVAVQAAKPWLQVP